MSQDDQSSRRDDLGEPEPTRPIAARDERESARSGTDRAEATEVTEATDPELQPLTHDREPDPDDDLAADPGWGAASAELDEGTAVRPTRAPASDTHAPDTHASDTHAPDAPAPAAPAPDAHDGEPEPADPGPADGDPVAYASSPSAAPGPRLTLGPERAPKTRRERRRGSVPRWLIPVVAIVALLVGLGGGVLGSVLYENFQDSDDRSGFSDSVNDLGVSTTAPLEEDNTSVEAVAAELLPSTVQVFASGEDDATGSGFVMDRDGHIITNNHVIAGAADDGTVEVQTTTGERFEVTVVGRSPVYDVAVLQADEAAAIEPVSFGEAGDLVVGQGVVAIGSPLGLAATVTHGIISAKNRPVTTGSSSDDASYINAVQTDAAINPGNSGGPLVNLAGQVVGVNSAIATTGGVAGSGGSIGVGFAIPSEQVLRTAAQIIETGEATYPIIGAQVQVGGRESGQGALVEEVNADSPAEAAGLESGDIVIGVDDLLITSGEQLIVALRSYAPGETVELTVLRDDEELTLDVTLGEQTG